MLVIPLYMSFLCNQSINSTDVGKSVELIGVDSGTTSTDQSSTKVTEDESNQLDNWKPMETDFLSKRNSYNIDIDDPGVATMGYSKFKLHYIPYL